MTEDEAKTKWCPFVRAPQWIVSDEDRRTPIAACNMGVDGSRDGAAVSCIGSACMAWRDKESGEFKSRAETAYRRDGARLIAGPADVDGYCGLAGAPR